jgi:hypothetical protein
LKKFTVNIEPYSVWGRGGEHRTHNWLPYVAPPFAAVMSRSVASYLWHRLIRTIPPVPSSCGLRCQGVAYLACVFRDYPCTPL